MHPSSLTENQSIVPAAILLGVLFFVGVYAGTAFAALVHSHPSFAASDQSGLLGKGIEGIRRF